MANTPFAATLLAWYAQNGRDLPWRNTRDPYAIWLSEVILQQTRIVQGMDYWHRFMQQWPTVEQLAAATEDEVLRMWQGLGYYSRARNLHVAARQIVDWGQFPADYKEILKLKGVGAYTAAAIASFAFDLPHAVVDGNVFRVLSRYFGIDTPIDTSQGQRLFAALAQDLLPEGEAAHYNQAIMDFGALQCTPRSPRCEVCPLLVTCHAATNGTQESLPVKQGKVKIRHRHLVYIMVECNGYVALHRRPAGDIWQGLWEPFLMEILPDSTVALPAWADAAMLMQADVRHVLTHQVLHTDLYALSCEQRPSLPQDYLWIARADIDRYALPRLLEKLMTPNDDTL